MGDQFVIGVFEIFFCGGKVGIVMGNCVFIGYFVVVWF